MTQYEIQQHTAFSQGVRDYQSGLLRNYDYSQDDTLQFYYDLGYAPVADMKKLCNQVYIQVNEQKCSKKLQVLE